MSLSAWIRYPLILLFGAIFSVIVMLSASYLYLAPQLPPAATIQDVTFQVPLRIYTADQKLMAEYGEQRRQPLRSDEIPKQFIDAILAAEDERFYSHHGVDPRGLVRAVIELMRYRDIRSGGSTITMQVARNFFLGREQRFLRKFNEIVLSLQIEQVLTKDEILQLYINKIYLGHRAYGIEAASQVYYGKRISELDLPQLAMIAGLPKAPSAYNPITNPQRALIRRNWILHRMEITGAISQAEREAAQQAPVTARFHAPRPEVDASYAAEMARIQAMPMVEGEIYLDGIRIYTTIDSNAQHAAITAIRNGLHAYDERHGYRGHLAKLDISRLPALPPINDAPQDAIPDSDPATIEGRDLDDTIEDLPSDLAEWARAIRHQRRVGNLEPVVITAVSEDGVDALFRYGKRETLSWENIQWAREQRSNRTLGAELERPSDRLAVGDVVHVRPVTNNGDTQWRLAQVPDAQAALAAVEPSTGAIKALQGGYSFATSNFNRAVQGQRQTGSVFKPFIYTAALENGFTPASIINDAPIVFNDASLETAWRPTGASGRFYGPVRIREALYRSLNLVSIRLLRQMGISQTLQTVERFGLPTSAYQRDLSLALGSAGSSPLMMSSAYSVFANGGYQVTPWLIDRIENADGDIIWQAPRVVLCDDACDIALDTREDAHLPEPIMAPRVLDERISWLMNSMLQDVINRGTGTAARRLGRSDLAGKTGTTNDLHDAWFAGYSTSLAATAWMGFDQPASLGRGEFGGRAALPIWIDFMAQALNGVADVPRPQPDGITEARIDPQSGLLARPENANAIREYFLTDNEPELEPARGADGEQRSPEHIF